MALTKYKLGELIKQRREKYDGLEDLPIKGVAREGFISPKQDGADLSIYNVYYLNDFVFNPARMELNSIALNTFWDKAICSSLYEIFYITRTDLLLPEYLNLFIKRDEFARKCWFEAVGSARNYFRVADLSEFDIELPDIPTQQKYVDIYKAMVANQQSYERGLEDLKLVLDATVEKYKFNYRRMSLAEITKESDARNLGMEFTEVKGVNKEKIFMPAVASGDDLSKYKIVRKNQFACNLMHVGRDVAIPIALQTEETPITVSPAYVVFDINNAEILPQYVLIWLSRSETDRHAWFMCDNNIRGGMEKKRFFEMDIPIPSLEDQNALVQLFEAISLRRTINEQLKAQIKDICPILIRGSLEEGI